MSYPESVLVAVQKATDENPDDIEAAISQAERAVRKLPDFDSLVGALISEAVRELVYRTRGVMNVQIKRDAAMYVGIAKVSSLSEGVAKVYRSVYEYKIASTTLGRLTGKQLPEVAESERAIAGGHLFNAELCEWLAEQVPEDKSVQQCVPEKRLRPMFVKIQKKYKAA